MELQLRDVSGGGEGVEMSEQHVSRDPSPSKGHQPFGFWF